MPSQEKQEQQSPFGPNFASFPMEIVNIDIGGPMRETSKGHKYFLVAVDCFTGMCVLSTLKGITAEEVFSAFYKEFVCIYGCPVSVKSDRGSQLIGEASKAFFDLLATIHIKTTPYSPWSNGAAEVTVRRTKTIISKFLIEGQTTRGENQEWDSLIKTVQLGLNSFPTTTRGFSPIYLYSGKEPFISANLSLPLENERKNVPHVVRTLRLRNQRIFELVGEVVGTSRARAKKYYDLRSTQEKYVKHDRVLLKKETLMAHELRTFAPVFEQTVYEVEDQLSDAIVKIRNPDTNKMKIVHFNNLKKFEEKKEERHSSRPTRQMIDADNDQTDGKRVIKD